MRSRRRKVEAGRHALGCWADEEVPVPCHGDISWAVHEEMRAVCPEEESWGSQMVSCRFRGLGLQERERWLPHAASDQQRSMSGVLEADVGLPKGRLSTGDG